MQSLELRLDFVMYAKSRAAYYCTVVDLGLELNAKRQSAMVMKEILGWIRAPLILGFCGWLLWNEVRNPTRGTKESKLLRSGRNLAIAAVAAASVQYVEMPIAWPLSIWAEVRNFGLVRIFGLPAWIEIPVTLLALDYTLYWWHLLNHRVAFLWRFHQPHHTDRDMDASTALRFHFGEVVLSTGWRAAQIVLIGVSPLAYSIWQIALILSILFHHSNLKLNKNVERLLGFVLVTPRMHEIHHSNIHSDSDSNWSSGLSLWDRLHGTLCEHEPSTNITIGVPAYSDEKDVVLTKVIKMPFTSQRESWRFPEG